MPRRIREPKPVVIEQTDHYRIERVEREFYVYDASGNLTGVRPNLDAALSLALSLLPAPRQTAQDVPNKPTPTDEPPAPETPHSAAPAASEEYSIAYDPARDLYVARGADGNEIAAGRSYYEADMAATEALASGRGGARPYAGRPPSSGAAIEEAVGRVERAATRGWLTDDQRRRLMRALGAVSQDAALATLNALLDEYRAHASHARDRATTAQDADAADLQRREAARLNAVANGILLAITALLDQ